MCHTKFNLITNLKRRVYQQVERGIHTPFRGILHRDHAELDVSGFGQAKHLFNARGLQKYDLFAEDLKRGLLAEGPTGTKSCNPDGCFCTSRAGDNLGEDSPHALVAGPVLCSRKRLSTSASRSGR